MSSIFDRIKTESKGDSATSIVKEFLNGERAETKTEIENPYGMTTFDLVALYCGNTKEQRSMLKLNRKVTTTDYLQFFGERLRINFISFGRKSRAEGVQVALGAKAEDEKRMRERFLEGVGLR